MEHRPRLPAAWIAFSYLQFNKHYSFSSGSGIRLASYFNLKKKSDLVPFFDLRKMIPMTAVMKAVKQQMIWLQCQQKTVCFSTKMLMGGFWSVLQMMRLSSLHTQIRSLGQSMSLVSQFWSSTAVRKKWAAKRSTLRNYFLAKANAL